jgi:hypothetical protein
MPSEAKRKATNFLSIPRVLLEGVRRIGLLCVPIGGLLLAAPVTANNKGLIQVAPAGASSLRLARESKDDDPLTQAAKHAADDPYPDASTIQLVESVHLRDEHEWQEAFAFDMGQAFRQAADAISVPFEYPPNPRRIPDGFGVVQLLANAVLRANLPCKSIYTVDSLDGGVHGWILMCDHKTNVYGIALVGKDWKLKQYIAAEPKIKSK